LEYVLREGLNPKGRVKPGILDYSQTPSYCRHGQEGPQKI
jgi:hypothetical protein